MTDSYSYTEAETFSLTHAREITAKVAADLLRFKRFYNAPSLEQINAYEAELIALLKADYLDNVTYGFQRDGKWVEALRYHAILGGLLVADDDPGKIRPGIDITGTRFASFLNYNSHWHALSETQKEKFIITLPFKRNGTNEPSLESGFWSSDHSYSAGGRGVRRSTIIH